MKVRIESAFQDGLATYIGNVDLASTTTTTTTTDTTHASNASRGPTVSASIAGASTGGREGGTRIGLAVEARLGFTILSEEGLVNG